MRNPGKYEVHVLNFLVSMKESVLHGNISSALIENLTASEIAEHLSKSDEFQGATIPSIVDRVSRTDAWRNRKKTFCSIYDTETFRNRQTSNDPYQEVQ